MICSNHETCFNEYRTYEVINKNVGYYSNSVESRHKFMKAHSWFICHKIKKRAPGPFSFAIENEF